MSEREDSSAEFSAGSASPRAFLVGIQGVDSTPELAQELFLELTDLVDTLGLTVAGAQMARVRGPNPGLIVGSGKAEEIISNARGCGAEVIILDDFLTPAQQRNWEKLSGEGLAVIDRQEVILDIFSSRAHTRDASLQVELARAIHALPRLKRQWTHLNRQRGMAGGLGGRAEGEQQLELDSRQLRSQIAKLKEQLVEVRQQRAVQRSRRLRKPVPVAALVGYTNAGKSSMLNALTAAGVLAENKLFATLDPTLRRLTLPGGQDILLADTVGFIRKLPHLLIEAFKSTLEETRLADYLIEVLDASDPNVLKHHETTQQVLHEIGVGLKPHIMVLNKCDRVTDETLRRRLLAVMPDSLFVSAQTGEGLPELVKELVIQTTAVMESMEVCIPHDRYDLMKMIRRVCSIEQESYDEQGCRLRLKVPPQQVESLRDFICPNS